MSRFQMNPGLLPCASLLSRRDVLRVGSLSIGASLLPSAWSSAAETSTNAKAAPNAKADSVIFLWMGRGVTHIDSFDPKPRDHWGMCGSIFFAGGGTNAGHVIGASDEQAAWPTTQPWGPADIAATIYEALGIPQDLRLPDQFGRPLPVLDHGQTIAGVF